MKAHVTSNTRVRRQRSAAKHLLCLLALLLCAWLPGAAKDASQPTPRLLRVLLVLSPDYPAAPEHPFLHAAVMESLAPLRFQLVTPSRDGERYHALDGQDLFAGGRASEYARNVYVQGTVDAVRANRYDVIWLFGERFEPEVMQAVSVAWRSGVPVLLWGGDARLLRDLGALPDLAPPDRATEPTGPAFANWSFEEGLAQQSAVTEKMIPAGTAVTNPGTVPAQPLLAWAERGHTGQRSCLLTYPEGKGAMLARLGTLALPRDVELADVPITLSGWIAGKGRSSVLLRNLANQAIVVESEPFLSPDAQWQPFSVTVHLPRGVMGATFGLEVANYGGTLYFDDLRLTADETLRSHAEKIQQLRARFGEQLPRWEQADHPLTGADLPSYGWTPLHGMTLAAGEQFQPLVFSTLRGEVALASFDIPTKGKLLLGAPGGVALLRDGRETQDAWFWYRVCGWLTGTPLPPARLTGAAQVPVITITTTPAITPPGQTATLQISPPQEVPFPRGSNLVVDIRDRSGRLLERTTAAADLPSPWAVRWAVPDLGPVGAYFRVTATVQRDDTVFARGENSLYVARQVDPRERLTFATRMSVLPSSTLVAQRLKAVYDTLGIDTVAGDLPSAVLERQGWLLAGDISRQFGWPNESFLELIPRWHDGPDALPYVRSSAYTRMTWTDITLPTGELSAEALSWFHRYLQARYTSLRDLNLAWGTQYPDWTAIPYREANAGLSATLTQEGGLPAIGQYLDTRGFLPWYRSQVVGTFIRDARTRYPWVYHHQPAPELPEFPPVSPQSALYSSAVVGDDAPSAAEDWYFLDDPVLQADIVGRQLVQGVGSFTSWSDIPLLLNADLTPTQGGARLGRLLTQLRDRAEGPYLHSYPERHSPVGIFEVDAAVPGITFPRWDALISGLRQQGWMPRQVTGDALDDPALRVLFFAQQAVSRETLAKLDAFVRCGGTLVTLPGAAAWNEHGVPAGRYMAPELVTLTGVSAQYGLQPAERMNWRHGAPIGLKLTAAQGLPSPPELPRTPYEHVTVTGNDVHLCALYPDGTPAVTYRQVGRGRALHMNTACPPADEAAQCAYARMLQAIITAAGLIPPLPRLVAGASTDGPSQVYWQRRQNATGDVAYLSAYLAAGADGMLARLLVPANARVRDLLCGEELPISADNSVTIRLVPGTWYYWTVRPRDPARLSLGYRLSAARHAEISLALTDARGGVWPQQRAVRLRVLRPDGQEVRALRRWIPVTGTATLTHRIALDDQPGTWTLEAFEPIANLLRSETFTVETTVKPMPVSSNALYGGTAAEVEQLLEALMLAYQGGSERSRLSYYLHVRGNDSRHAVVRQLERLDWAPAEPLLLAALRTGDVFTLTGEDLGCLSGTCQRDHATVDNQVLEVIQHLVNNADAILVPHEWPSTVLCRIGKGMLILDRTSLDETYPPDNRGGEPSRLDAWVTAWRDVLPAAQQHHAVSPRKSLDVATWLRQGLPAIEATLALPLSWRLLSQAYLSSDLRMTVRRMAVDPTHDRRRQERDVQRLLTTATDKEIDACLSQEYPLVISTAVLGYDPRTGMWEDEAARRRILATLQRLINKADTLWVPLGWPDTLVCALKKRVLIIDRGGITDGAQGTAWRDAMQGASIRLTESRLNLAAWYQGGLLAAAPATAFPLYWRMLSQGYLNEAPDERSRYLLYQSDATRTTLVHDFSAVITTLDRKRLTAVFSHEHPLLLTAPMLGYRPQEKLWGDLAGRRSLMVLQSLLTDAVAERWDEPDKHGSVLRITHPQGRLYLYNGDPRIFADSPLKGLLTMRENPEAWEPVPVDFSLERWLVEVNRRNP